MFGIFRTLILIAVAFVAGVLFERNNQKTLCEETGGIWRASVCVRS